jgi:hypothetical protein
MDAMAGATGLFARWLRILGFGLDPFEVAVRRAQAKLNRTILVGTTVPEATSRSIVEAADCWRPDQFGDLEKECLQAEDCFGRIHGGVA